MGKVRVLFNELTAGQVTAAQAAAELRKMTFVQSDGYTDTVVEDSIDEAFSMFPDDVTERWLGK